MQLLYFIIIVEEKNLTNNFTIFYVHNNLKDLDFCFFMENTLKPIYYKILLLHR